MINNIANEKPIAVIDGASSFRSQDVPHFVISIEDKEKNQEKNSLTGSVIGISETESLPVEVRMIRPQGEIVSLKKIDTAGILEIDTPPDVGLEREFIPGTYKLQVVNADLEIIAEHEFTWGVLAINLDKSIYTTDEKAFISMAVLDDQGMMVCDAKVTLFITDPRGGITILQTDNSATSDGDNFEGDNSAVNKTNSITISPECGVYGLTHLPDYYATYQAAGEGNYTLNLTAITPNGERRIVDAFVVRNEEEFTIQRIGPTRIYPLARQTMNLTITATQDYNGSIVEYLPISFDVIDPPEGLFVDIINYTKVLTWNETLHAGETKTLSYTFDAPDKSPDFFVLGPLEIGNWKETRQWQIASDLQLQISDVGGKDIELFAVNETAIGIMFLNNSNNQIQFMIQNTTGTTKAGPFTLTTGEINITRIGAAMINTTDVALGWLNTSGAVSRLTIYNVDGVQKVAPTDVDFGTSIGPNRHDLSIVVTQGTGGDGNGGQRIFYCYFDSNEGDADIQILNTTLGNATGEIDVDTGTSALQNVQNWVDCAAINQTSVGIAYLDVGVSQPTYAIYNSSATAKTSVAAFQTGGAGGLSQVVSTGINTTWGERFIVGWYNNTNQDIAIRIFASDNAITVPTQPGEVNVGTSSRLAIGTVNNKSSEGDLFVLAWYNDSDTNIYAKVLNGSGTTVTSSFVVEQNPTGHPWLMDIVGSQLPFNQSLCPSKFAISYGNSTGVQILKYYDVNGSEWEGNCQITTANNAPTVTTPVIYPTTAYTNSTLNASTNYTDTEGTAGTVYFKWYVNGINVRNETNNSVTSRTNASTSLHPNNISRGDLVNVTVYANDGTDNSTTNASTILTISNLVPEVSNVILNATDNPTNFSNANLTVYWTVTDTDVDNITNITDWRINLTSIALVNIPFENNSYDLSGSNGVMMDYSTFSNNATGTVKFNLTASRNRSGAVEFVDDNKFDLVSGKSGQTNFNWTDAFTVSVWINMTIGSKTIMEDLMMVNGNPGWFITVNQSRPNFLLKDGTDGIDCQSQTRINDSTWHYLTYINNASGRTIFIDGRLDTSCTDGPYRFGSNPAPALRIGLGQGGVNGFIGTMDDLIIFNQSLDIKQILILNSSTNNLIDSSLTRFGDNWSACVTSNDRYQDGIVLCSNNLTIINGRPIVSNVILNATDNPTNSTDANLTVYFAVTDSDGDNVKNITDWSFNRTSIALLNMPFENNTRNMSNYTKDYSLFSKNGTVDGATYNNTGGFDGYGAYQFDGINDRINISDASINAFALNGTTNFTAVMWVKYVGGASQTLLGRRSSSGFLLQINVAQNLPDFFTDDIVAGNQNCIGSTGFANNTWTHLVFRWNGTHKDLFVNGVESGFLSCAANGAYTASTSRWYESGFDLTVGMTSAKGGFLKGSLDDLMVFNKSLTTKEIVLIYQNRTDLIDSPSTETGQIWQACVTGNDGLGDGSETCSNNLTIAANVTNTLPGAPSLVRPLNNSFITNRTPSFAWNNSVDADANTLTYQILVDDNSAFNNVEINVSSIAEGTTNTSYDSATTLDVDTTYYWKVRANDSTGYGDFSNVSNFTLQSLLSITILTDTVAFGNHGRNERNDTTVNNPPPFRAENNGNIISNVTVTATSYFISVDFPSYNYQFRIEQNETDAFETARSNTTWVNMTGSSASPHVVNLNWLSIKNDFLTGINISVPGEEPPGAKSSTVTFTIE